MNDNSVRFLHYRAFAADGTVLPYGGATVAYRKVGDGQVVYAVATCRNKNLQPDVKSAYSDNFNRRRGRDIALGRLMDDSSGKRHEIGTAPGNEQATFWEYMDQRMQDALGYRRRRRAVPASQTGLIEQSPCACNVPSCC